jgi:hypothetical protein
MTGNGATLRMKAWQAMRRTSSLLCVLHMTVKGAIKTLRMEAWQAT